MPATNPMTAPASRRPFGARRRAPAAGALAALLASTLLAASGCGGGPAIIEAENDPNYRPVDEPRPTDVDLIAELQGTAAAATARAERLQGELDEAVASLAAAENANRDLAEEIVQLELDLADALGQVASLEAERSAPPRIPRASVVELEAVADLGEAPIGYRWYELEGTGFAIPYPATWSVQVRQSSRTQTTLDIVPLGPGVRMTIDIWNYPNRNVDLVAIYGPAVAALDNEGRFGQMIQNLTEVDLIADQPTQVVRYRYHRPGEQTSSNRSFRYLATIDLVEQGGEGDRYRTVLADTTFQADRRSEMEGHWNTMLRNIRIHAN